jgi:flagellar basal-body rod protein FlgB
MDTSTITALSQALDYGSASITAISNNMSNVNTPGYKRKDVTFSAALDDAEDNLQPVTIQSTDSRAIPFDDQAASPVQYVTDSSGSMRVDGNNVDIDMEASRLAAANIFYQGAAQLMQNQFAGLKYAISGGS